MSFTFINEEKEEDQLPFAFVCKFRSGVFLLKNDKKRQKIIAIYLYFSD